MGCEWMDCEWMGWERMGWRELGWRELAMPDGPERSEQDRAATAGEAGFWTSGVRLFSVGLDLVGEEIERAPERIGELLQDPAVHAAENEKIHQVLKKRNDQKR
eukprot:TRINITY_DN57488_c0_g1_i1.p2 TRINITY_DN57488_c0_g1~~TRINITY_DN57488_c0_g1_i1.p2  ORF type:complete len:104 (-),score=33.21 TRINITY_DN57488_c0_g1_i1:25-336(-)